MHSAKTSLPIDRKTESIARSKIVLTLAEETKRISPWLIHTSKILKTEYSTEVIQSARRDGVKCPLIVRPCKCDFLSKNHFEIVDGHSRHAGVITNRNLLCIVKMLSDEEAIQEMLILESKGHKSAYWKSQAIHKLVEIKEKEFKEKGIKKGAKKAVAKIINKDNVESGQALVSQYESIYELFSHIKTLTSLSHEDVRCIKSLDKDSLLELAGSNRGVLPSILVNWLKNPKLSIKEVKRNLTGYKSRSYRSIREEKRARYRKYPRRTKFYPPKPDVLNVDIPTDAIERIRRIAYWIEEIFEKELKGKKIHYTKKNKILWKLWAKRKRTMPEMTIELLLMGIEDVELGRREGTINICFEVVGDVPIGYRSIFKERIRRAIWNQTQPGAREDFGAEKKVTEIILETARDDKPKKIEPIELRFEDETQS